MKSILIWLACALLYLIVVSGILTTIVLINQRLEQVSWLMQSIQMLTILVVGLGLVSLMNRHYQRLTPNPLLRDWQWRPTLLATGYGFILLLATQIYDQLRQTIGLPPSNPQNQQLLLDILKVAPLPLFVYAGLIAPIAEELLCRGILSEIIRKWTSSHYVIIIITSCVFALPHALPTDVDFIIYATMGAILGVCYLHTRQLKYAILAHFINNLISLIIMWYEIQS